MTSESDVLAYLANKFSFARDVFVYRALYNYYKQWEGNRGVRICVDGM